MIASYQVSDGIKIHGICCMTSPDTESTFRVAVFGELRLKLFVFNIQLPDHDDKTLVNLVSLSRIVFFTKQWQVSRIV
ncbi:hypothetical protein Hdeb2414_s0001g00031791 [Helianthus debilis subsp. tardiflorus]